MATNFVAKLPTSLHLSLWHSETEWVSLPQCSYSHIQRKKLTCAERVNNDFLVVLGDIVINFYKLFKNYSHLNTQIFFFEPYLRCMECIAYDSSRSF